MRIVILGNAGSGKSTLGKSLARAHRAPMLDLDTIVWEPDRIAVERPHARVLADLAQFCRESDDWVIEGCYGDLVHAALRHEPLLVFLEPGRDVCIANCRSRGWEPHKYRSKAQQDAQLDAMLDWVATYYDRDGPVSLACHREVFDAYRGPRRLVTHRDQLAALLPPPSGAAPQASASNPAFSVSDAVRPPTRDRSLAR